MRLRSDIWVSAYIRRCAVEDAVAALRRRGAAEAGAIFIKIDRLDGRAALFGPAPQTETGDRGVDRLWTRLHRDEWTDPLATEERLRKEINFDPDLWIVEVEDRAGRNFLDLTD
jgi:hypothetical protein